MTTINLTDLAPYTVCLLEDRTDGSLFIVGPDGAGYDVSACADREDGCADYHAFAAGETDQWTVPTVQFTDDDLASIVILVAHSSDPAAPALHVAPTLEWSKGAWAYWWR